MDPGTSWPSKISGEDWPSMARSGVLEIEARALVKLSNLPESKSACSLVHLPLQPGWMHLVIWSGSALISGKDILYYSIFYLKIQRKKRSVKLDNGYWMV